MRIKRVQLNVCWFYCEHFNYMCIEAIGDEAYFLQVYCHWQWWVFTFADINRGESLLFNFVYSKSKKLITVCILFFCMVCHLEKKFINVVY